MEKKYFYGNEISSYGVENGRVDYRTLAKCFDAVLNNGIMENTYNIGYWEQESGFVDDTDEIEELEAQVEELEYILCDMMNDDMEDTEEYKQKEKEKEELEEQIEELKQEQDDIGEIFQYYIVSDNGARLLKEETNEIVFYNDTLDMYVWGVTHYGTSWDYVLTDIEIDW